MAEQRNKSGWTEILSKHHSRTAQMNKGTTDISIQDNKANQLTPGTQTVTLQNTTSNRTEKNKTTNKTANQLKPTTIPIKLPTMAIPSENKNKHYA